MILKDRYKRVKGSIFYQDFDDVLTLKLSVSKSTTELEKLEDLAGILGIQSEREKECLSCIFSNLQTICKKMRRHRTARFGLKYSRNKSFYSPQLRRNYGFYTYTYVIKIIDLLHEHGFVEQKIGKQGSRFEDGTLSRIVPTKKLMEFLPIMTRSNRDGSFKINYPRDPIILKDKCKRQVHVPANAQTRQVRFKLERFNREAELHTLTMKIGMNTVRQYRSSAEGIFEYANPNYDLLTFVDHIEFLSDTLAFLPRELSCEGDPVHWTVLYDLSKVVKCNRVFNNNSMKQGGRFYGSIVTNLPKLFRKCLKIDGKDTVELDYSGFHPSMLWNREGLLALADPYTLSINNFPPEELRPFAKTAFNILVNSSSETEANYAFKKHLRDEVLTLPPSITQDALFSGIKELHKPIKHRFFTGVGLELQYLDSQIAESILMHFCDKHELALSIHDSFIVKKEFENELREIMQEEYKNKFGYEIKIK